MKRTFRGAAVIAALFLFLSVTSETICGSVLYKKVIPCQSAKVQRVYSYGDTKSGELDFSKLEGCTVILHTNDVHGRVFHGTNGSLGILALAALKEKCIDSGAEVILLDAGDTFRGTPISNFDQGASIVALMNAIGYDAMVSGNHDYEYGFKHLMELSCDMNFPVLGANVIGLDTNHRVLEERMLIKKNNVTYGIFGLVTKATMTINKEENVQGITVIDPVLSAKMEAAYLKAAGADIIIALSHLGIKDSENDNSLDILKNVPEIDLLIDGHSHSTLNDCRKANSSKSTLFVSSGQYLNTIGAVVIDKNQNMKAYSITKEFLADLGIDLENYDGFGTTVKLVERVLSEAEAKIPQDAWIQVGPTTVSMTLVPEKKVEEVTASVPVMLSTSPVSLIKPEDIKINYRMYRMYLRSN